MGSMCCGVMELGNMWCGVPEHVWCDGAWTLYSMAWQNIGITWCGVMAHVYYLVWCDVTWALFCVV